MFGDDLAPAEQGTSLGQVVPPTQQHTPTPPGEPRQNPGVTRDRHSEVVVPAHAPVQSITYQIEGLPAGLPPEKMGITKEIFEKIGNAATEKNCIIMIRKTNEGSIIYFQSATGMGKKLPTKGKSSNWPVALGNIPFFASMAKKVNNWFMEQTTLIEVASYKKNTDGLPQANQANKYTYIPKLFALNDPLIISKTVLVKPGELNRTAVIGGISYYFKYINFDELNNEFRHYKMSEPYFLIGTTNRFCYRVYAKMERFINRVGETMIISHLYHI